MRMLCKPNLHNLYTFYSTKFLLMDVVSNQLFLTIKLERGV